MHVCIAENCRHSIRSCFFLAREYLPACAGQHHVQGRLKLLSFLVGLLCFDRRWLLIDDRTIGQRFLRRLMGHSYRSVLCQVRHRYALWIRTHLQPGIDMVELNRKARLLLRKHSFPLPRLRVSTRLPIRPSASFFCVVSGIAAVTFRAGTRKERLVLLKNVAVLLKNVAATLARRMHGSRAPKRHRRHEEKP